MKVSELVNEVKSELENEKMELVKSVLTDRLEEVETAKVIYDKLLSDYNKLLDMEVTKLYYDLVD